jgi:hypothetical protein
LISGEQNLDAVIFCHAKQFAVLQTGPAHIGCGEDIVTPEESPQGVIEIFVQQYLHCRLR